LRELSRKFGLDYFPAIHRDSCFYLALIGGVCFWGILWFYRPETSKTGGHLPPWGFISLVLWRPFLEELLFRGALQGQFLRQKWGRISWGGFSLANGLTSFLFTGAHLLFQSSPWALGIILPSFIFGFFRDRYQSIYPSFVLHAYYNGGFFLFIGVSLG